MDTDVLGLFLVYFVNHIPTYVVWGIGIIISILRRRKHPQVSLLTILSLIVFMISGIAQPYITFWYQYKLMEGVYYAKEVGFYLGIMSMFSSLIHSVIWVLLLIAIFGWRDSSGENTT